MMFNLINITTKANQDTQTSEYLQNECNLNTVRETSNINSHSSYVFAITFILHFFIILYSQKILKWTQHNLHIIQTTSHTE